MDEAASQSCDIFVIGGGINGCGIARDAAGRGYSVVLAEMNDLASGTSSWSTKLVHGGLRYLEFYEFRLVREALKEREVLWASAPHIIKPLRFVLPHHEGLRPAWLLRLGLFLYDHMGGRRLLPPTRMLAMDQDVAGAPLKPLFTRAFEYSDCWVDDARLVVLNARDAADRGARINTRTRVTAIRRQGGAWSVTTEDRRSGNRAEYRAGLVVNAAGPWVDQVLRGPLGNRDAHNVRLVKGSHIVVGRLYDHDKCYLFQNADGRIIFAIPYEDRYTLLGTTDMDYEGDPADARITGQEIEYLCAAASEYFADPVQPKDMVWSYSGVRPLFDDGASKAQEATREYVLRLDGGGDEGALLNVYGGKITTYRKLAEAAMDKIGEVLEPRGAPWTARAVLPGGDFPPESYDARLGEMIEAHPGLDRALVARLFRLYGTDTATVLQGAASSADLGRHFGADLFEAEIRHLMAREWAVEADDVLWRRTKLGLAIDADRRDELVRFMQEQPTPA